MQYALALLALVASVSAQTATGTPPSCSTDFPESFVIAPVNLSSSAHSKRDLDAQTAALCSAPPLITLKGGVLTDQNKRTGEIVANHQFQFDDVLQSGRIYDAGFSVCQNKSLAIGGNYNFWTCISGDFSNIYDQSQGDQCHEAAIRVYACGSGSGLSSLATSAATSAPTSASSTPSTSATTSATPVAATTAATTSSLPGPAVASVAPYPARNTTTAAGTASATAPGHATSSALTAPASGASAITVGSTFGLVAAALVAFAMF